MNKIYNDKITISVTHYHYSCVFVAGIKIVLMYDSTFNKVWKDECVAVQLVGLCVCSKKKKKKMVNVQAENNWWSGISCN